MQKLKKYTSVFLLLVFAWVLTPAPFLHDILANHHDTDCRFDNHKGTAHIEPIHTHCDIFQTNTPLYDAPKITQIEKPVLVPVAELSTAIRVAYVHSFEADLPARAPPVC